MFNVQIPAPEAKFPDRISAPAPRGMRDEIKRAAESLGTTYSAFIRDAVESRLAALTLARAPAGAVYPSSCRTS